METAGGRGRAQPHSQGGRGPREHSAGLQRPSRPPPRPPSTRLQKDTTDASASVSSLTSSSWSSPRRPWPAQTASSGWLGTKGPVSRQPPGPGQAGGGVTAGNRRRPQRRPGCASWPRWDSQPRIWAFSPATSPSPASTSRAGSGISMTNLRLSLKRGLRAWQPRARVAVCLSDGGGREGVPGLAGLHGKRPPTRQASHPRKVDRAWPPRSVGPGQAITSKHRECEL